MNDFENGGNLSGTPLRDVFANLAIIFFVLFALVALQSLMKTPKEEKKEVQVIMFGDIMITIKWPDKEDIDVDLWARSPDDPQPVGYSRPRGITFALLKDITDAGPKNPTGRMREVMFGDGMPDGQYTVNVHLYRNGSRLVEVPVDAEVFALDGSRAVSIVKGKVVLTGVGQEITIGNFTLKRGKVVGVPDDIYVPLRVGSSAGEGVGP